ILIMTYIAVFLSATVQLRWINPAGLGYVPLASLVVATKFGDMGAYFVGRLFGRTKLSPVISPGKTRAGAVGAVCGAAIGAWLWSEWGTPCVASAAPPHWAWAIVFGMIMGVAGLVGDLAESLLKRDTGQKDSAPLLPEFGGLLDLVDSVIFAGPVAYLLWM